jgi:hypothetical protein
VKGWVLPVAIRIDCASAGYLRYLCSASALKRQTAFLTFAVLEKHSPEYVALRFRQAELPDCEPHLDAIVQIGNVLRTARARDICRALFGDTSSTLVSLLSRASHDAFPQHVYGHLIDLACRPEHRDRVELLRSGDKITKENVEVVLRLSPALLCREALVRLYSQKQADQLIAALELIRALHPTLADADILWSLRALSGATSLGNWAARWIDKAERFLITPPLLDDQDVTFLASPKAMREAGQGTFRNCLATKTLAVALGRAAYFAWRSDAVVELEALSRGWVMSGIHGPRNSRVDRALMRTIRTKFEAAGVLVPARYAQAAAVNRCARLLPIYDFGCPDLGDEDDAEEIDLNELRDVA